LVHRAIRSLIRSNKKVSGVVRVEGAKAIAKTDIIPTSCPVSMKLELISQSLSAALMKPLAMWSTG